MDRYCPNCGEKIKEKNNYCPNCGEKVEEKKKHNKDYEEPVQPVTEETSEDKNALIGYILGFTSIGACFIPIVAYPVTICGIIFSIKGLKSSTKKNMAMTGLILSIVFLAIAIINSIIGAIIGFYSAINLMNYYY